MEIGLENVGFKTLVCAELDADCRQTLKANRPEWRLFDDTTNRTAGDIRSISASELLAISGRKRGDVDLVTGGAPCQPFSNMGKKEGKHDQKNGDLFEHFVRVVKGVSPKAFIFENVAGIVQNKHQDVVEYMTRRFDGEGYNIVCDVLNAADYGVPQARKRFIMIGIKNKPAMMPLPTHSNGHLNWKKFTKTLNKTPDYTPKTWPTVGEAFQRISPQRLSRSDNLGMKHSDKIVQRIKLIGQDENFKVLPMEMRPNCWKNGKHQGHDTFGRMNPKKPSPTIRTAGYNPTKGKYIHPTEHRGITTAEMAALQSFPEHWEFKTKSGKPSIVSIGKQIGNAVPPKFAEALGKAVIKSLNLES